MIVDLEKKWVIHAKCAGVDPELFFTDHSANVVYRNSPTRKVASEWEKAKIFCADCPVRRQCARDGLGEMEGVWGGMDPAQRLVLRRTHSEKVRRLTGSLKKEYAKLAYDLRLRHLAYHDVARIIGIGLSTAQYLCTTVGLSCPRTTLARPRTTSGSR